MTPEELQRVLQTEGDRQRNLDFWSRHPFVLLLLIIAALIVIYFLSVS